MNRAVGATEGIRDEKFNYEEEEVGLLIQSHIDSALFSSIDGSACYYYYYYSIN